MRRSLEKIERLFRDTLARGQARGEIAPTADIDATARFLIAGIQGLRLLGKANPDRKVLEGVAAVMLGCLDR